MIIAEHARLSKNSRRQVGLAAIHLARADRWRTLSGITTPVEVIEAHLRSHGVSTVVIVGCNFPNCPRMSVYEASERDFRIVLVSDAVSGLYDRGVAELKNIGVTVVSTSELLDATGTAIATGQAEKWRER